jgi:hypothetical protein
MDLNSLSQNPEQLKQLIAALQSLLPSDSQPTSIPEEDDEEEVVSPIKTKNSRQRSKKVVNKFLSMPEMNMHKEDSDVDRKLAKHPPVARSREFEPVEVTCRVCGVSETINPSLVESVSRYKCNKCSTSAG